MAARKWILWGAVGLCALIAILLGAFSILRRQRADIGGKTDASLPVSSSSFANGGFIPQRLTCDGGDISPEIQIPQAPAGTKSFAIVMDDLDTPFGFVHWLIYNIPADAHAIAEGASAHGQLSQAAVEGVNNFDKIGYGGPCPPGADPHHYALRLYALDVTPRLPPGSTKKQLAAAVKGHVLGEGQIVGLYRRGSH